MTQLHAQHPEATSAGPAPCPRCGWHRVAALNASAAESPEALIEELSYEKRALLETVAELERAVTQLRRDALTDPLTGLSNRRSLWSQLRLEVEAAESQQVPFCLLFVDIDHFKRLNDGFGHLSGDLVLRQLAELLRGHLRGSDVVAARDGEGAMLARYGGEEFVVVLGSLGMDDAIGVAERLRELVRSVPFHSSDRRALPTMTVSVGVAEYDFVEDSWDFEGVLDRADAALYDAKNAGRDCVRARRVAQSLA